LATKQIDDEWVADQLAECLAGRPNYPSPDEGAVYRITRRINQYLADPWTDQSVEELRQCARKDWAEVADLEKAATIVSRDLDGWKKIRDGREPGSMSRVEAERIIAALETTIATLRRPRGYLTSPGLVGRIADKGPPPKPWALMAAGVADEVYRALKHTGDKREGIGGPDGPVTKFLARFLELVMPGKIPASSTINEAVAAHLSSSLAYRRGVY
jgi:hypothetical protein